MKNAFKILLATLILALASCNTTDTGGSNDNYKSPNFPKPSSTITVSSTQNIKSDKDYKMVGVKSKGLGAGDQKENQRPVFNVYGKTLSNVIILAPAADGVHCYNSSTLKGIVWDDIGEDGFTLLGTKLTLEDCIARKGADKFGQINGPRSATNLTVIVKNCYIEGVQRAFRLNGGNNARKHNLTIIIEDSVFKDCRTIVRNTVGKVTVEYKNCTFINVKEPFFGCTVKDKGGNKVIK